VLDGISAEEAEYSRDGHRIAYISYPQRTLWVQQVDRSNPIQLTRPPMTSWLPHRSPDSRQIVFSARSNAAEAAQQHGIRLEVVKHPMAKRGFVLLPKRWVVERSFAWAARFRRLARDYERLQTSLKGFHYIAFSCIMLSRMFQLLQ
jgi:transposase